MAWFSGTTSGYLDLMDKLAEYASADNVLSAVPSAAGTGYVVGDTLAVSGGTSTTAASLTVTSVGGSGEVTGVAVVHGGAYSVQPSNPATTTGGSGSGCTLTLTFQSAGWQVLRQTTGKFVITPGSIISGGTGYAVDDVITLDSSGAANTTAAVEATLKVTAESSGVVTALEVVTQGSYSASASDTLPTTTGGSGSGLTLQPVFTGVAGEQQLILQGSGGGSDEIYVGVRSYSVSGIGAKNWELVGLTGFTEAGTWVAQPGISPGRYDSVTAFDGGCFLPLRNVSMNYWASITARRIILVAQTGSNYHNAFLGFIDPLATSDQYPYPLMVLGTSSEPSVEATTSDAGLGGMPDPILDDSSTTIGPGFIRSTSGSWKSVRNADEESGTLSSLTLASVNIWPCNNRATITLPSIDNWVNSQPDASMPNFIGRTIGSTPPLRLEPTPNTAGALSPIFPLTLIDWDGQFLMGTIPDAFWVCASRDGSSSAVSGDLFTVGSNRYRVFQNVGRTEYYNFFCLKEG